MGIEKMSMSNECTALAFPAQRFKTDPKCNKSSTSNNLGQNIDTKDTVDQIFELYKNYIVAEAEADLDAALFNAMQRIDSAADAEANFDGVIFKSTQQNSVNRLVVIEKIPSESQNLSKESLETRKLKNTSSKVTCVGILLMTAFACMTTLATTRYISII